MTQVFASAIDEDSCSVECLHPDAIRPLLGRTLGPDGARRVAEVFAVLADPTRARIIHLLALSVRELCVCDIALVLGISVSALSHQLRTLRERGLVERRRDGRLMYYRLSDARLGTLIMDAVTEVAA
jgi:ArsR family transcriptional regulator